MTKLANLEVNVWNKDGKDEIEGIKRLAVGVILQAIKDLKHKESPVIRHEARQFFRGPGFKLWVEAGLGWRGAYVERMRKKIIRGEIDAEMLRKH